MKAVVDSSFWSNESAWPYEGADHTFLLRVVNAVGRAIYQENWTSKEYVAASLTMLPAGRHAAREHDKLVANRLLVQHRPQLSRPATRVIKTPGFTAFEIASFTDGEWAEARDVQKIVESPRIEAKRRLEDVTERIVQNLRNGELVSNLRPVEGGHFSGPLSAGYWNTELWGSRFAKGQLDPENPFAPIYASQNAKWIFVAREGVASCLRYIRPVDLTLSKAIKTQRWLELQMNESPDRRPADLTKENLEERAKGKFDIGKREFERAWNKALESTGARWSKPGPSPGSTRRR